jgi:hypothetical protein
VRRKSFTASVNCEKNVERTTHVAKNRSRCGALDAPGFGKIALLAGYLGGRPQSALQ